VPPSSGSDFRFSPKPDSPSALVLTLLLDRP